MRSTAQDFHERICGSRVGLPSVFIILALKKLVIAFCLFFAYYFLANNLQKGEKPMERKFKNFGEFLKFHRAKMNLTQMELGEKLGVSVESVRCWERQKFKPNPTKIHAIAELFNTDFDEVYTYANL